MVGNPEPNEPRVCERCGASGLVWWWLYTEDEAVCFPCHAKNLTTWWSQNGAAV